MPTFSEISLFEKIMQFYRFNTYSLANEKVVRQQVLQYVTSQKKPHRKGLSHSKVIKKDTFTI
jgi:hypothetical protein